MILKAVCLVLVMMSAIALIGDAFRSISVTRSLISAVVTHRDPGMFWRVVKNAAQVVQIGAWNALFPRARTLVLYLDAETGGVMTPTSIGDHLKCIVGLAPVSANGGTTAGANGTTGFDRTGYLSCVLIVNVGLSGAITSVDAKIRDCDTIGGAYADYVPPTGTAAITQITANSTTNTVNVNLLGARQFVLVSQVTVGTAILTSSNIAFGGASVEPASNSQT